MDTKLKKLNSSRLYKVFLLAIIVLSVVSSLFYFRVFIGSEFIFDTISHDEYSSSFNITTIVGNVLREVIVSNNEYDLDNIRLDDNVNYRIEKRDGAIITNLSSPNSNFIDYRLYYKAEFYGSNKANINTNVKNYEFTSNYNKNNRLKSVIFSFKKSYIDNLINNWNKNKTRFMHSIYILPPVITIGIIAFVLFIISIGTNKENKKIKLYCFDKIKFEFYIFFFFIILKFYDSLFFRILNGSSGISDIELYLLTIAVLFIVLYLIFVISTLVKRIKSRTYLESSYYGKLRKLIGKILHLFKNDNANIKIIYSIMFSFLLIVIFIIMTGLVNAFRILSLSIIIFIWYIMYSFIFKYYKDMEKISSERLKEMIKSQSYKSELITNVSHDLKTPLTSIIGYIDLLKKEGIDSENSKDYIEILDKKSQNLSILLNDLFELSKTSSGNIDYEIEKIDLKKIIEQTIADLDEVNNSQIRTNLEESLYVYVNGDRFYRVIQNLLDNAIKYSLDSTRIYIDLFKEGDKSIIKFKNISKYEMNFDSKEIISRFKRGDESRSSSGSGLGLSIVDTFVTAFGGDFNVEIVGDMFIAIIKFDYISD